MPLKNEKKINEYFQSMLSTMSRLQTQIPTEAAQEVAETVTDLIADARVLLALLDEESLQ